MLTFGTGKRVMDKYNVGKEPKCIFIYVQTYGRFCDSRHLTLFFDGLDTVTVVLTMRKRILL